MSFPRANAVSKPLLRFYSAIHVLTRGWFPPTPHSMAGFLRISFRPRSKTELIRGPRKKKRSPGCNDSLGPLGAGAPILPVAGSEGSNSEAPTSCWGATAGTARRGRSGGRRAPAARCSRWGWRGGGGGVVGWVGVSEPIFNKRTRHQSQNQSRYQLGTRVHFVNKCKTDLFAVDLCLQSLLACAVGQEPFWFWTASLRTEKVCLLTSDWLGPNAPHKSWRSISESCLGICSECTLPDVITVA